MSDPINLFESYLEIYEGKPVAAPADEPDPFGRPGGKYGGVKKGGGYDKGWQAIKREIERIDRDKDSATKRRYKEMKEDNSENTSYETVDERVNVTRLGPKPTFKPRSRERDIGKHNDWKDKPLEWGQRPEKALKLKRRAKAVTDTQKREDKEVGLRREDLEYILDYIVSEGYADTYDSAIPILESMSDEWLEDIIDEAAKDQSNKQLDRAMKTTYKAQNVIDNRHQGRMGSKFASLHPPERDSKVDRMRTRLSARRKEVGAEKVRRAEENLKKLSKYLNK